MGLWQGCTGVGDRTQGATKTVGIALLVDGIEGAEQGASSRVDEVNAGEVPASDTDSEIDEGAVCGR